jgi:hypothetical protein
VCTHTSLCLAQGGICIGSGIKGGGAAASKGAPDKARSTTIKSALGH